MSGRGRKRAPVGKDEPESVLAGLHPASVLALVITLSTAAFVFSQPAYLAAALAATWALNAAAGFNRNFMRYMALGVPLVILIMAVNAALAPGTGGAAVSLGRLGFKISLEGVRYGLSMGLRLLTVMGAFCFLSLGADPDDVLSLVEGESRALMALAVALRLVALLKDDGKRIVNVQRCRGALRMGKVRFALHVLIIMLESALERSWQMAESMQARGFGSGARSRYFRLVFRPRDLMVVLTLVAAASTAAFALYHGWGCSRGPEAAGTLFRQGMNVGLFLFFLSLPAIISWGCCRWSWLMSKM